MIRQLTFALFLLLTGVLASCSGSGPDPLFKAMPSSTTGIDFSNILNYDGSVSILDFEYLYNGGGVAVGDLNNDGLQDLYFTGNMISSELYLNRGDWKFEKVTETAGVGTIAWANGATMVDINQDGWLDIYVCRGGPRGTPADRRANLLFINNGPSDDSATVTFTEAAAEYGLDNTEYSVQAAFFDYDKDGDLDVYLLSNALVDYNRNVSRPQVDDGKAPSVDKLFRNNGDNTFSEVSVEAGIRFEGFGLGVEICDINEDGWPDVYVSNDFLTDDILYINRQDGTFRNQTNRYFKHLTYNGMGNDLADFNNDGLVDVMVLDMLPEDNRRWKLTMMGNNYDEFQTERSYGYHPQYIRNTLQLNNGNGSFSEIGQLAGVDATEWSWAALFADYDNDGMKDLLVTNGFRHDITNLDFMVYGNRVLQMGDPETNRKLRLEELYKLPGIKIHNYLFKNQGDLTFRDVSEEWGLGAPTYSNGAVYADLDNDGDLDLAINNIDEEASLYRNRTGEAATSENASNYLRLGFQGPPRNRQGLGAKVYLRHQGTLQYQYFTTCRGYTSSVEPFLHFGLGRTATIDSVEVIWPDGRYQLLRQVPANQVVILNYEEAGPSSGRAAQASAAPPLFLEMSEKTGIEYRHRENEYVDFKVQPLLPHMHSRYGPGIAVGDLNGDRLEDFYVGGATGYEGGLFLQSPDGTFVRKDPGLDARAEDMGVLFFDADNDGDQDLYLSSGGSAQVEGSALYADRFYLNDGSGGFIPAPDAIPNLRESGSCVVAADYDRDGDLDLFVGGRIVPGAYPMPAGSYLLRNDFSEKGKATFTDITEEMDTGFRNLGLVTSALWTDYDNDGWTDLLIAGEFMPLRFYQNQQGKLVDRTEATGLKNTSGWWNSLAGGDFDNDGDTDYLAGNLGLNSRYHASPREPLCIYANDYDKNGRIDPVMCHFVQGKNYIAHSRDDMIKQVNAMRARFKTYEEYAEATFEESFLPQEIADAYVVRSERFESSYIENLGDGKFAIRALPLRAQVAPIFGILPSDVNGDGKLDALVVGNAYATEVASGQYDASIGLCLQGDGKGNFHPVDVRKSGFFADKDAKGMAAITLSDGGELILVGNNSGELQVFKTQENKAEVYPLKNDDTYALITMKNGTNYKQEFYYGAGYLSHSSRTLKLNPGVQSVVIFNTAGESRTLKEIF